MKFLKSFHLFENINQAKSILKSLNKDITDSSYLEIRNILKGRDGYVGWFTELHYKNNYSLTELHELYDYIKMNSAYISKLPKDLLSYNNIEAIQDDIEIIRRESSYNKIVGEFPIKQRAYLKETDKELLQNLSTRKDSKDFFRKVSSYHTRKNLIDALKSFISVDPNASLNKVMKEAKASGSDIIYHSYDTNMLIVRVYNSNQLNKIAGDCSWCIRGESTFRSYVSSDSKQFIIFLFNRTDNLSRIGVTARLTSDNFYYTAHNKIDQYISYKELSSLLNEYKFDSDQILKFKLSDVNVNDTSVKQLLKSFKLSTEEIIKLKSKFKSSDLEQFTKEEIEKYDLLDKSEISINLLLKFELKEIIAKNMIQRLDELNIGGILSMYYRYGYPIITYLKKNKEILNLLSAYPPYNQSKADIDFFKEDILSGFNSNHLEVGNYWNDNNKYNYDRTIFRILWFKDEIKQKIDSGDILIKNILDIRDSDKFIINILADMEVNLESIYSAIKLRNFNFEQLSEVAKLLKENKIDTSKIIIEIFEEIKKSGKTESYYIAGYKESGLFTDKQIQEIEEINKFIKFRKAIPHSPYDRDMTKIYASDFYEKWNEYTLEKVKSLPGEYIESIIIMYAKIDKLKYLEQFKFKFKGYDGQRTVGELNDIISGIFRTNGGMKESLSENECKNIYLFLTNKCDLSELTINAYRGKEGETVRANIGDERKFYMSSIYLYDRDEFDKYLIYELSIMEYNMSKDGIFIPELGNKEKSVTNRIYELSNLFKYLIIKEDIDGIEELINTLVTFDLSLSELKYLTNIILRVNDKLNKSTKDILIREFKQKSRSENVIREYTKLLNY